MTTLTTYDKVRRLVNFATGEDWGDGYLVTDVISGYAEPGYGDNDSVVVLGNWNPKRFPHGDEPPLTPEENMGPRLAAALERVGAEIEWLDEWTSCHGCLRAVRTEPDSYSWQPSYTCTDDGLYCRDCLFEWGEDALEEYINDPKKCVTWCGPAHVEDMGYVKWEPGNPHTYESGWHPGQTDDPEAIWAAIRDAYPDEDVKIVFFLDEASQFYIRFSAYVKREDEEDE